MTIKVIRCNDDHAAEKFINEEIEKLTEYKYGITDKGAHIFICHYKEVNNEGRSTEKKANPPGNKGRGKSPKDAKLTN